MSETTDEIKAKDIADFEKAAKQLDTILKRIHRYCPKANLYANDAGLSLMKGPTHDGTYADACHENEVLCVRVASLGGGD